VALGSTVTVPNSVSVSDWPERVRRLADQLTADGDLRTPVWWEALLAVPRHEFVPTITSWTSTAAGGLDATRTA
jgi:hypothetical protein